MTEIQVEQRSSDWYDLRRSVCLTASCFADAIGIGRGKPYDFLRHLVSKFDHTDDDDDDLPNSCQSHGIQFESVIDGAYQLLTGYCTKPSGFWIADHDDSLAGLIGASPDAKVYQQDGVGQCIGLAEYKAPVYSMYTGIPRSHMAQMQGQMAVCHAAWCDYMAICDKTKDIKLNRVYFEPVYWQHISTLLKDFCLIVQLARQRHSSGFDPLRFPEAEAIRTRSMSVDPFPGEDLIIVDDMLRVRNDDDKTCYFQGLSKTWLSYNDLIG